MTKWGWAAVAALTLAAGCATTETFPPVTAGRFAAAERAVTAARNVGADRDPQAHKHLRLAEEQLAAARESAQAGDHRGGHLLVARAEADAELSQLLRQHARAQADAATTERQLAETRGASRSPPSPAPSSPPPGATAPPVQ